MAFEKNLNGDDLIARISEILDKAEQFGKKRADQVGTEIGKALSDGIQEEMDNAKKDVKSSVGELMVEWQKLVRSINNNKLQMKPEKIKVVLDTAAALKDTERFGKEVRKQLSGITATFNGVKIKGLDAVVEKFKTSSEELESIDWGFGKHHDTMIQQATKQADAVKNVGDAAKATQTAVEKLTRREKDLTNILDKLKEIKNETNAFNDPSVQKTEEKVRKLTDALDEYQTKLDAMKRLRKGNERTMYDTAQSEIADLKRALGAIQAVKDQTPSIKPKIEKKEKEVEQETPKKTMTQGPKIPVVGAGDSAKSIQEQTSAVKQQAGAMESLGKSAEKAAKQVDSMSDPAKQKKYADYINAQIKDTERSIKNQQDWIRHLGWVFEDERFASSGKKDAYDKLKSAAREYSGISRDKDAGRYVAEDAIELATIAWKKAYDEAVKQGVAERRLYDYKPPMWLYDSRLETVQKDYDFRKKALERDEVQLTSLKQIQGNIEGFAQLCDVLGEYRQCVKDINSGDKALSESAALKLEGVKKNLSAGIDIKDIDKQNALLDIRKKLRADGYSIEQIATDYISRIGFLGERVNKELGTLTQEQETAAIQANTKAVEENIKAKQKLSKLQETYLDTRKVYEVRSGENINFFPTREKAEESAKGIRLLGFEAEVTSKKLNELNQAQRESFESIYYRPSVVYEPGKSFELKGDDLNTYIAMIEGLEDFTSQYKRLQKLRASGITSAKIKPNQNMLDTFGFMLNESEDIDNKQIELLERILTQRLSNEDRLQGLLEQGRADIEGRIPKADPNSTWADMARRYDSLSSQVKNITQQLFETPSGQLTLFEGMSDPVFETVEATNELTDALKNVEQIAGQISFDEYVKDIKDIVYHAGDLSNIAKTLKSFPLGNVPPYKGAGIGGLTGLYTTEDVDGFWGNEWSGAPISTIDLSYYKLFDARKTEMADKLGSFLNDLNSAIYGYYESVDEKDWTLVKYTDTKSVDELYKAFQELFKDSNLSLEKFTQFIQGARELVSGKNFADLDLPAIDEGIAKSGISRALQDVSQELFNSDSFKTLLLKTLGYEGVDLRGSKYNGTYSGGTVIFDVKPESIKTINENWSDVMRRNGYDITEQDLEMEKKRRQLAFETAKAFSKQVPIQPTVEPNAVGAAIEESTGGAPVEVPVAPVVEDAAVTQVSSDIINKLINGTNIEQLLTKYGIPSNKFDTGIDLFKDLAGALYQEGGRAGGEKVGEAFAQLADFIEKNAERTEQVTKTLEEFYNYMSQVQIRIPENMEKTFEAENPDDWKRIKKLYSIGGNYQNKKRLITTSKYASTPDVLLEELLANGFGHALGVDNNFNGSAQDSLRLILDAVQRAKDEAKLGKTQKIIGLDAEAQAAMYTDLSEAASAVEQNYKALSVAASVVNVSNDDTAESAEQTGEALKNQARSAEDAANAMRGLQEQEQGDKKTVPPIGSDPKQPTDTINKATRDALEQLQRASDNKTALIDLSGVNSVGELENQIRNMAQAIVGSELKVDSVTVQDDIARIVLYNEQLGITASQMWRLQEATEDANKAQLELISQTEKYSPRAAQRYSVAQQAKIDKDNRWLISQMSALDKKEFSYKYSNKKISGDTEILYPDEKYFGKTIDELAKNIRERIENSMDGALTEVIRNEVLDAQRILDSEIKVAQANKYVKGKLSAQEVVEAKATREYELDTFEERAKKENVFTQLKDDIKAMRDELAGVTEQDSSGLDRFVDKMRTAKAHLTLETTKQSSIKQELRNYDQATKAQDRLYNAKKRLAKLEAEGKTDKELSRNIDELDERYRASINVLQGEKQIADILEREATLETELKNIRVTAESEQAKRAKATEDKKFSDQLKSFYSSWIKILGEINDADSQINKLTLQDKGTGLYTNRIQDVQTAKSAKIAELRTLQDAINQTLSFDSTSQDSGFNGFLKYCRENAILTTEEIQKLDNALIKSDYIAQDFAIESANQKLKEQKEIYNDLLAAVKKYNEADYNWQQADISGGNKGPYNDQMNLYLRQIDAAVSRMDENGYELSLEQEVELNKINNEHLQRKNKLLEEAASKEQKYNQQASDITSKVWSQIDQWEKDHSFTRIFSDELQSEILAFADSLSNLDQKTNFTALGKQWDQIVAKTQKATEANQAYIDSRWKDRFQNDYQYYSMPSSYDDGQFYVYGNGKTRQDQGVLDQMADYYRQEVEKAEKFGENIQDVYKRLMEASKSYNTVSEKMSSIALKDNGTGLYSKTLENLQDQKSALRGEISALGQEITDMLSLDTMSANNPFKAFFEDTRVQAALTTEEITKFQDVLSQMDSSNFNFISKVAEKVQPFVENLKLLSEMLSKGVIDGKSDKNVDLVGNILKTNEGYSKLWGQFKEQPDAGSASELFKFVNANEQYINSVIKAASAEAKYFESKKQYANIANMQDYDAATKSMDNMSEGSKNAKESLESFVKSFTGGKGIITDFTTSANGISKINFGVLEEGTNQFRTFSAEIGTFTDKVYTYETSMKNMTVGTEAAKKALASMSQVMSRLNGQGFTVDNNDYAKKLNEKMQSLYKVQQKAATSNDVSTQQDLQNQANEAMRLIKIINQLENAYLKMNEAADGENVLKGNKLDTTKNMYAQMVDQAEQMRQATNATAVSIDGFDKVTNKLTFTLEDADGQVKTFVMSMDKLSGVATAQVKSIDRVKTGLQEFLSGIGDPGQKLLQYGLRMVEVYDIIRYLRQGFNEVLEIDTAMTELKKVTDETAVAYDNFAKSAYASSKKIGSTMKEFIQATADFARLGYSIDEASQLAEAANVYKNVGNGIDDVAQASESIISTMKAFNIEATDSMGIVDRFNEIKIACLHIW